MSLRSHHSLHTRFRSVPSRQVRRNPAMQVMRLTRNAYQTCMEEQIWEMGSFEESSTGLPMCIWLSPGFPPLDQPRMQVNKGYEGCDAYQDDGVTLNWFTVTVEEQPQVLEEDTGCITQADIELVKQFIRLNLDTILAFWREDISGFELCDGLKSLHYPTLEGRKLLRKKNKLFKKKMKQMEKIEKNRGAFSKCRPKAACV